MSWQGTRITAAALATVCASSLLACSPATNPTMPATSASQLSPSGDAPTLAPGDRARATSTRSHSPRLPERTQAQQRFEAAAAPIAQRAIGPVAVAARDKRGNTVAIESTTPSLEASIVKVEILISLLYQRHEAGGSLDAAERELAELMIVESDNDAADELWRAQGEAEGLDQAHALLGLHDTVTGTDGMWGMTTTSATDQLAVLGALVSPTSPLTADDREYIVSLMSRVDPEQAWGVRAVGPGPVKEGWLDPDEGEPWVLNSIGIVTPDGGEPVEVAVLTSGWDSFEEGRDAVESLARAAAEALRG